MMVFIYVIIVLIFVAFVLGVLYLILTIEKKHARKKAIMSLSVIDEFRKSLQSSTQYIDTLSQIINTLSPKGYSGYFHNFQIGYSKYDLGYYVSAEIYKTKEMRKKNYPNKRFFCTMEDDMGNYHRPTFYINTRKEATILLNNLLDKEIDKLKIFYKTDIEKLTVWED